MTELSNISVDIVVITYNHADYIEKAIYSLLYQSFPGKIRIIVCEDASSDSTLEKCNFLASKYYPKINVISSETNIGMMENFIKSIEACTADYIAFCEGDDFWIDNDKLSKQIRFLESNTEYSMIFSNRIIVDRIGVYINDNIYEKPVYTIKDVWEGFIAPTQTIVMRNFYGIAEFIKRNHHGYSGDRFLTLYASIFGPIYRLEDKTAAYRDSGTGAWSSYTSLQKLDKNLDELKQFHQLMGLPPNNQVLVKASVQYIVQLNSYYFKRPFKFLKAEVFSKTIKEWRYTRSTIKMVLLFQTLFKKMLSILKK